MIVSSCTLSLGPYTPTMQSSFHKSFTILPDSTSEFQIASTCTYSTIVFLTKIPTPPLCVVLAAHPNHLYPPITMSVSTTTWLSEIIAMCTPYLIKRVLSSHSLFYNPLILKCIILILFISYYFCTAVLIYCWVIYLRSSFSCHIQLPYIFLQIIFAFLKFSLPPNFLYILLQWLSLCRSSIGKQI